MAKSKNLGRHVNLQIHSHRIYIVNFISENIEDIFYRKIKVMGNQHPSFFRIEFKKTLQ